MRSFFIMFGQCFMLFFGFAVGCPGAVPFSTTIESINSQGFPHIDVAVNLFTRKAVKAPSKDDFVLSEEGKSVDKFKIAVDKRPIYVALVLDRSGSMSGAMKHLKRATYSFVKLVEEEAYCQLITFSDDIVEHTKFTCDVKDIKPHIAAMRPYGATALYDAVGRAVRNVGFYPDSSKRVVVAFTDGKDQNARRTARLSKLTAKELVKSARAKGVALYFIGLGRELNEKLMTKAAKLTGGAYFHAPDKKQLKAIFTQVARMVEKGYRIYYDTPNPKPDGTWRRVTISSKIAGKEDQGKGKYRAPKHIRSDGKAGSQDQASLQAGKIPSPAISPLRWKEIGFSVDPATFEKIDFSSELLKPSLISEFANSLDEDDPVRAELADGIAQTNGIISGAYAQANHALAPILVRMAKKIVANNFEGLKSDEKEACEILRNAREVVQNEVSSFKDFASDCRKRSSSRYMKVLGGSTIFGNTHLASTSMFAQSESIRNDLFTSVYHNHDYRLFVKHYNVMVDNWNQLKAKVPVKE